MSDHRLYSEDSVNRMLDYVKAVKAVQQFLNAADAYETLIAADEVRQVIARHGL